MSFCAISFTACWARATASPYPGTITTDSALASRKLASSADPERTVLSAAPAAAAPSAAPHPPMITLQKERFIALHMMEERNAPEDPTRDAAIMTMGVLSEKPMPAAAQPAQPSSIEHTTGR